MGSERRKSGWGICTSRSRTWPSITSSRIPRSAPAAGSSIASWWTLRPGCSRAAACGSSPARAKARIRFGCAWPRPSGTRRSSSAGAASRSSAPRSRGTEEMAGRAGTPRLPVRMARLEDAPGLVPLFETFYGAFFGGRVTETAVAGRLRLAAPHESVIVAEVDDRLTGFASLRVTDSLDPDPYAELADLFVEPESRRLGVASRLVQYPHGLPRPHRASHLGLLTGQADTEALAFYRSAGYEEFATAMRKPLKLAESQ